MMSDKPLPTDLEIDPIFPGLRLDPQHVIEHKRAPAFNDWKRFGCTPLDRRPPAWFRGNSNRNRLMHGVCRLAAQLGGSRSRVCRQGRKI